MRSEIFLKTNQNPKGFNLKTGKYLYYYLLLVFIS